MAYHTFGRNFQYLFGRLNPSPTFEARASSEYGTIKQLIENRAGPAGILAPSCFLQGSYRQDTAIYSINDVDIVALCSLWQPPPTSPSPSVGQPAKSWTRDEIFDTLAAPLFADGRYAGKVRYHRGSMCIKVDLGIKVEILPVVYRRGNDDAKSEPFRLWRPHLASWEDGYARSHQELLTAKNAQQRTAGNFKPAIKIFKYIRSRFSLDAVSFHIESLLWQVPDYLFKGTPADWIPALATYLESLSAIQWYASVVNTPVGERDIFTDSEWGFSSWCAFHKLISSLAPLARLARDTADKSTAVDAWQTILGKDFFPAYQD